MKTEQTDEELNRRLAELVGWKIFEWGVHKPGDAKPIGRGYKSIDELLPNFCTDLNEVAKVEAGLKGNHQLCTYESYLRRAVFLDDKDENWTPEQTAQTCFFMATARQRTIALIQTLS